MRAKPKKQRVRRVFKKELRSESRQSRQKVAPKPEPKPEVVNNWQVEPAAGYDSKRLAAYIGRGLPT